MSRFATCVLTVAVVAGASLCGFARAESIFGLNLVGSRVSVGDARVAALGGFVQVIDDSLGALQYNPATIAWCKRVTFGAGGYVTSDKNRDATLEEKTVSTKFSSFIFAFPLYKKRLSFAVGYRGRYDPDGDFSVRETTSEGVPYTNLYARNGNLWTVPFTLALDAGRYLKVGGYYSIENGTIEDRWVIDFTGASTADAVSVRTRQFRGNAWGAGAVLRPRHGLALAVAYESKIDYDVPVEERYTNSSANADYTETMTLPERWTASASVHLPARFILYAGGSVADFTKFQGLAFPADRLVREENAALGVEHQFKGGRFPLRASFRYEQLPYTLPAGEKVKGTAITVGTGLPFRGGRGKLDMALEFGKSGSTGVNEYSDRSVRFYLSITGSEEWKRRRERQF